MIDSDRILRRQEAAADQIYERGLLVAAWRFQLIGPLLDASLSPDAQQAARQRLLSDRVLSPWGPAWRLSARTLRRWCAAYRKGGLAGLVPRSRQDKGQLRTVPIKALTRALELRAEDGRRTVVKLIELLGAENSEWGEFARTTLDRHLRANGSRRQRQGPAGPFQSFEAEAPNELWQGDTLHGPMVVWRGKTVRSRVVSWLDDYSRLVTHLEAYPDETLPSIEDALRKAILKHGRPWRLFVDNAKVYSGRAFTMACSELGVTKIHSTPHYPVSRGKQERLFGTLRQQLINEVENLDAPLTLEEFNRYLTAWVERYHDTEHSKTRQSPRQRYAARPVAPRPVSWEALELAFLQWVLRDISPCGEIKFAGNLYFVDPSLVAKNQVIRYDPFDLARIYVWRDGRVAATATAERLIHQQRPGKPRPSHQRGAQTAQRYLDSLERAHHERLARERNQTPYPSEED